MLDDIRQQIDHLNQQVIELKKQGQYSQGIAIGKQACELARQHLGDAAADPDFAASLYNLAELYVELGDYASAEPLYQQTLDLGRSILGEQHPDVATILDRLAGLHEARGDYAKAEPLFRQALEIRRRRTALGKEHSDLITSLDNLAGVCKQMDYYEEAESLYQEAVEMARTILGEEHPKLATLLENWGILYKTRGSYALASELYQQALKIKRTTLGENHSSFAASLYNLARLSDAMGNYSVSEERYQQALAIWRTTLGESHPYFATGLNGLAELYESMGKHALAEKHYQQALEIRRTVLGETHPDVGSTLNGLGGAYESMGNYAKAEGSYQQALKIWGMTLGENHSAFATGLNNLATLYEAMGDYSKAEELYQQALASRRTILGESHLLFAESLDNLAGLHYAKGNYDEALEPYHQALNIRRTTLGESHPSVASNLNNLAALHYAKSNYNEALEYWQQVLEIRRTSLGEAHPLYAQVLNNLAASYKMTGNYTVAEPLYEGARVIWSEALGEEHPEVATSSNNLAGLYVATQRESKAMSLMQQAEAINDQMIGQIFSISSERQRMAYFAVRQKDFNRFLSLLPLWAVPTAVLAGFELVLRRKAIGAEALAVKRDAILGGRYPALRPKLEEWTTLRQEIAQKSLAGRGSEGLDSHLKLLAEWNAQKEGLEAELARQIPEMNLEQKLRAADGQAVVKALPSESVLVEFVRFKVYDFKAIPALGEPQWKPARYLAFVLQAGEPDKVQMIDLGEAEPIERMIAAMRRTITGETEPKANSDEASQVSDAENNSGASKSESRQTRHVRPFSPSADMSEGDGTALRAALFDPLLPALGGCTRLFLAPDGDLNRLPFEVLPTNDGRRLIDDYQISYLGVGRDMLRFGAESTLTATAPLVVADPDFDLAHDAPVRIPSPPLGRQSRDLDRNALHFNRLSGTRTEGEQVAAMLAVKPLLEQDALERTLKACQSPRILHLATHGFFLSNQKGDINQDKLVVTGQMTQEGRLSGAGLENPLLRSGLALAGANTWLKEKPLPPEAEDGILTAEDVSGLDLLATELVVLSACQTGLGEVQVGEGVFGLRRAFMLAGAKTLVMSLWKVPDQQTQELMSNFYRRILAGKPRAEALRQAQLAMKVKYPEPYYWGAFICQGDPSPLSLLGA